MNDIISPPSKWVSEMIARIEPGGTLIDIACGRGRHSIEFSKNFFIFFIVIIRNLIECILKIPRFIASCVM